MANMKINCSKCHGQRHVTCQENDFINVAIQLQGSKQNISVPFNVSCSIHKNSKNTFIVDPINTSSKNNEIFVNWTRPSSTIKEYLVYCMTSTTHQYQQISTNQISFDNLSENTWHQVCIASIDNLWRTSQFTCRHVLTNVSDNVTTTKYITTSTTTSNTTSTTWLSVNSTSKIPVLNRPTWSLYAVPIVAVAIGLMFLACISIAIRKLKVIIQSRKLKKQNEISPVSIKLKRMNNTEIKTNEFSNIYELQSRNDHKPIIIEYARLMNQSVLFEESLGLTMKLAQEPQNIYKNRFANISPYDQNRVILRNKKASRDYINASIIPFQDDEDNIEFIASQGPIASTVSDFWQMIWEQNVHIIIMLIRPQENDQFKCVQYWPTYEGDNIFYGTDGQYQVILKSEENLESHYERMIVVFNKKLQMERNIHQFHMPSWSDYEEPRLDNFDKLLLRYHRVSSLNTQSPFLVHCSAGVGATGTFIAIDRIIKNLLNYSPTVNIFQTVLELRLRRNFMVQRLVQYKFIYKYIDYFLKKYMTDAEYGGSLRSYFPIGQVEDSV